MFVEIINVQNFNNVQWITHTQFRHVIIASQIDEYLKKRVRLLNVC